MTCVEQELVEVPIGDGGAMTRLDAALLRKRRCVADSKLLRRADIKDDPILSSYPMNRHECWGRRKDGTWLFILSERLISSEEATRLAEYMAACLEEFPK